MQRHPSIRRTARIAGTALAVMLVVSPAAARKANRGVESVHQPHVERTDFVFDVPAGKDGKLDTAAQAHLTGWFDALGLRYGDRVTIAGAKGYDLAALREGIQATVERYGLLTQGEAPLTAGTPPVGSLRVVVSRSTASVPGCPSWRDKAEANLTGGLSDNYGCSMASNLAAMVADPRDLVEGRHTNTDLRTATSTRAIEVYQKKQPTGAGDLKVMSAGGQ